MEYRPRRGVSSSWPDQCSTAISVMRVVLHVADVFSATKFVSVIVMKHRSSFEMITRRQQGHRFVVVPVYRAFQSPGPLAKRLVFRVKLHPEMIHPISLLQNFLL